MKHHECLANGAPAYTGPATPLRAVLVGEHAARALDLLLTRARSDQAGRVLLDMPLEEARALVRFVDAWCDRIDVARAQSVVHRDALPELADEITKERTP